MEVKQYMDKNKVIAIKLQFDEIIHVIENTEVEYWYARDLMPLLGYERWENFEKVVKRAIESCKASEICCSDQKTGADRGTDFLYRAK